MNYILETERLRLREFTLNDTAFIIELLNSPGWLQFIGNRNVNTNEQAMAYIVNGPLKSYKGNGYGLWLVERKENGKSIGMCGIINREYLDNPDIGFALLPGDQGNGYALEIVKATMKYARQQLQISKMDAITIAENERSIRILEKIGLRFSKTFCFPDSKDALLIYSD